MENKTQSNKKQGIMELYQKSCLFDKQCSLQYVSTEFANGSKHTKTQCAKCGYSAGTPISRKILEPSDIIHPFNQELYDSVYNKKWNELYGMSPDVIEVQRKLHQIRKRTKLDYYKKLLGIDSVEFEDVYEPYLLSEHWRNKRKTILERDNYTCRYCEKAKATEVHHLSYQNLGNEPDFELISVCRPCHELIHEIKVEPSPNSWEDETDKPNEGHPD